MTTRFPQLEFSEETGLVEDDLTLIQGIGPAIARRLQSTGIARYADLARQTPESLAARFTDMIGITPARIQRQDWIGQALTMMSDSPDQGEMLPAENSQSRQHYAVYTVELLLDEALKVRRTRALHVQTQQDRTWAGWDGAAVLAFIQEQAGLPGLQQPTAQPPEEQKPEAVLPKAAPETVPSTAAPSLSGEFRVKEMQMVMRGETQSPWAASAGQPFNIRLGLDLTQVEYPPDKTLQYQATVYAKKVGQADRQILGRSRGALALADQFTVDVRCQVIEKGSYRMEVLVAILPQDGHPNPADQIVALSEGRLLTVN